MRADADGFENQVKQEMADSRRHLIFHRDSSAGNERDFVSQFASQCGDDAESSGRFRLYRAGNHRARERRVSRQYTHLTTDDKRAAMRRRLPEVTSG